MLKKAGKEIIIYNQVTLIHEEQETETVCEQFLVSKSNFQTLLHDTEKREKRISSQTISLA